MSEGSTTQKEIICSQIYSQFNFNFDLDIYLTLTFMLYKIVHKMWNIIRNALKETKWNRLNYSSDDDRYIEAYVVKPTREYTCLDHNDPGFGDTDYTMPSN